MAPLKRNTPRTLAAVVAFVAGAAPVWPANADAEAYDRARAATAVTIAVEERYEATSQWTGTVRQADLPLVRQPYADLAQRLFELAGIAIASESRDAPALRIEAHGVTEATLYDTSINGVRLRETMYRAARITGTIALDTAAGTILRPFEGTIPPPFDFMVTYGYDPYRDPANAPFREAFEAPGGYAQAIARLVGDIYGDAVLEAARSDRDPLVRRAAELALAQP